MGRHETGIDGSEEVSGEPGRLAVVPEMSFVKIKLGFRGETKPLHLWRWSLARAYAQDLAVEGFRAWARRRRASSLRWASGHRNRLGPLDKAVPDLFE